MHGNLRRRGSWLLLAAAAGMLAGAAPVPAAPAAGDDLTPARDLRGTWVSALRGKGFQLAGRLAVPGSGTADIVENGDIRLVITKVVAQKAPATTSYRAYATISISLKQIVETVTVTTVEGPKRMPPLKLPVNGAASTRPVVLTVSSSRVGARFLVGGATVSMQGSFTTDLMSGVMTETFGRSSGIPGVPGVLMGPLEGTFHLMRSR